MNTSINYDVAQEMLDLIKEAQRQLEQIDPDSSANWRGSIHTNTMLLLNAAIAKATNDTQTI